MDDKTLVQCSEFDTVSILKAAMINAVARLERCRGRKEQQELHQFILNCAREINSLLRTCSQTNADHRGPRTERYDFPNGETLIRTSFV